MTCSGEGAFGAILGSQQSLDCTFKPIDQPPQSYTASITKIGLDIGVTGKTVLVWSVLAPTAQLKPKALSGTYVGGAASVSVGIGGGANLLVGGFDQTITLQPLSVQGQTGVNLAVGVAGLSLE